MKKVEKINRVADQMAVLSNWELQRGVIRMDTPDSVRSGVFHCDINEHADYLLFGRTSKENAESSTTMFRRLGAALDSNCSLLILDMSTPFNLGGLVRIHRQLKKIILFGVRLYDSEIDLRNIPENFHKIILIETHSITDLLKDTELKRDLWSRIKPAN